MNHKYLINMILNSLKKSVRAIVCILLIEIPMVTFPQGMKIKEMKPILSDLSASTYQRCDSSGIPCGLVKVQVSNSNLKFGGKVVGKVDNKVNEYWVYLPQGTRELTIKRPNCLPIPVHFKDYGIEEIESKTCYLLLLKETSFNYEKNTAIINVKPTTAKIIIDNCEIDADESGSYKLFLEKGEHVFKVFADGYSPSVEIVKTGKGVQTINIELESLMANVSLDCLTPDAEIFVDHNKLGVGSWHGNLLAGKYVIEARKKGYKTNSLSVMLGEKESKSIVIPALEKAIIPILIKTTPSDCYSRKIIIDGNVVGVDSLCKVIIPSGKHKFEIQISGCMAISKNIYIEKPDTLEFHLNPENALFESAYNGEYASCYKLGKSFSSDYKNPDINQAKFWFDKVIKGIDSIEPKWLTEYYKELISFYNGKVNDIDAVNKVIGRLEFIINNHNLDWTVLNERDIAVAYQKNKNYNQAIRWFESWILKAKSINSYNYSYAFEDLANCYKEMGDLEHALFYILKAQTIYANYSYDIASLYYEKGDIKNAIVWYKKFYKEMRYDKPDTEITDLNKVDFIKEMKIKGIYEKVVN